MTSEELYTRLLEFAKNSQKLIRILQPTIYHKAYGEQLIRSSASPGANYIEALEAMSRKDFIHKLKICRKETKESIHWLTLIQAANEGNTEVQKRCALLIAEARELIRIFTSSILTSEKKLSIIT